MSTAHQLPSLPGRGRGRVDLTGCLCSQLRVYPPAVARRDGRWLESLNLYTLDLVQAHVELIERLAEHYLKLLNSDGDTINLLIEHAYQHRDNFKQYIETITSAENEVDRQVIEQIGDKENVKEKILAEQQQIAKRRQKILDDVF